MKITIKNRFLKLFVFKNSSGYDIYFYLLGLPILIIITSYSAFFEYAVIGFKKVTDSVNITILGPLLTISYFIYGNYKEFIISIFGITIEIKVKQNDDN